jgi:hypothetical protein
MYAEERQEADKECGARRARWDVNATPSVFPFAENNQSHEHQAFATAGSTAAYCWRVAVLYRGLLCWQVARLV